MFTVEIRINGSLVSHIYGVNVTDSHPINNGKGDRYDCQVYDVEKRQGIVTFRGHGKNVIRALFVDGAQQVVSAGDDLQLRKWNIEDGKEVGKIVRPQSVEAITQELARLA